MTKPEARLSSDEGFVGWAWIGNVVGWSIGAMFGGLLMRFVASLLIHDLLDAVIDPATGGAVVPDHVAVLLTATLIGATMGSIIGSQAVRFPVAAAALVAMIYVASWSLAPAALLRLSAWWTTVSAGVLIATAVASAALWSRRRGAHVHSE